VDNDLNLGLFMILNYCMSSEIKSVKIMGKNCQLWLPTFSCWKYGSKIL